MLAVVVDCNTNVTRLGHDLHVQTEDSGPKHAHIVTQVYALGGLLVYSRKYDYREYLSSSDLTHKVRHAMNALHAATLKAIQSGQLDELITQKLSLCKTQEAPKPEPEVKAEPIRHFWDRLLEKRKQEAPEEPPPAPQPRKGWDAAVASAKASKRA